MQRVGGGKKYWATAYFKKKFMAIEWVEKKIMPMLQLIFYFS